MVWVSEGGNRGGGGVSTHALHTTSLVVWCRRGAVRQDWEPDGMV